MHERERHLALVRERALHDETTALRVAREEGEMKGELKAARKIARKLIEQPDLDDAIIVRLTDLSEDEVQRLRQQPAD